MNKERKVLITECADNKGLIAKITNICFNHQLNIIRNDEFVDGEHNRFYMRTELEGVFSDTKLLNALKSELPPHAQNRLVTKSRKRIVVMVTKEPHCIGELLMKSVYGSLNAEIVAIIGNYPDLEELAEKFNIPFYHVSHKASGRESQENNLKKIIDSYNPEYLVLAKYMRILSPAFVEHYPNKIINIHHSFLPAFIGAKPYHQAYNRGVKIIGATAHFVNNNLDEGPIISQDVIRVDHRHSANEMAQAGRQVEESVLTHALQQVFNEKVFVYGNRTVVFD